MPLFRDTSKGLVPIKDLAFKLEKDLQSLVESNLDSLMGLQQVKSEFTIKHRRIDTLAFDAESKAFVIIEYKRNKNFSVVDQGMSYLQLMLDNKAEFIVEYNENMKATLKRSDVDWSQSRLIFVAPGFTQDQKEATNFRDFNIELYEVRRYEGDIINVVRHSSRQDAPSFKEVAGNSKAATEIKKELKNYSEEEHFAKGSEHSIELYKTYKTALLNTVDDLSVVPLKEVVAFKLKRPLYCIKIQKSNIKLWINLKVGELDDPRNLARNMKGVGHHGVGDYQFDISDEEDLEYIMSLVKQASKKMK